MGPIIIIIQQCEAIFYQYPIFLIFFGGEGYILCHFSDELTGKQLFTLAFFRQG